MVFVSEVIVIGTVYSKSASESLSAMDMPVASLSQTKGLVPISGCFNIERGIRTLWLAEN